MNLEDVQEMNRAVVIRLLRRSNSSSRAQIARASGLKQATVSNIINDFLQRGIVKETGAMHGRKGRRCIGVSLNTEDFRVIGVRLERHYVRLALFDLTGRMEQGDDQALDPLADGESVMATIVSSVQSMVDRAAGYRVLSAGIAIPGPYLSTEGRPAWVTELPGFNSVPVKTRLSAALTIPVLIEHDAKAAALAKWWSMVTHDDKQTIVYLTIGQGVGAGIVMEGNLLRGSCGTAGEIGHFTIDHNGPQCACGNRGCLELYCSTIALLRAARSVRGEDLALGQVREAFLRGEPWATGVVEESARHLGIGLVSVVNAYGAGRIIIGDEMSSFGERYLDVVKGAMSERTNPLIARSLHIELDASGRDEVLAGVGALAVGHALGQGLLRSG